MILKTKMNHQSSGKRKTMEYIRDFFFFLYNLLKRLGKGGAASIEHAMFTGKGSILDSAT